MVVDTLSRAAALGALGSSTFRCYVTIEGMKMGKFAGEAPEQKFKDRIVALGFHYQVVSPRDSASGLPTGKRQHKPIAFTKEWGAASPQIFQALVTNETLKNVLFEFVQPTPTGVQQTVFTIKLGNASVASVDQRAGLAAATPEIPNEARLLEDVSLTYQRIEIADLLTKTSATDDLTH